MNQTKITDELLRQAARLRFMELLSWQAIANELNCGESTLRKYNTEQEPRWIKAVDETVAEMRRDALPTGYGCLLLQARHGDVSAAKELLNRAEGAAAQRLELTGANGGPVAMTWWETLEAATAKDKGNGNTETPDSPDA